MKFFNFHQLGYIIVFISAVRPIVDSEGYPARVPQPVFYEPSLTTLQLRQEKLDELRKNDLYWERRIENLQKNHAKIQEIMELEYKKAVRLVPSLMYLTFSFILFIDRWTKCVEKG